jgi:penicillin amidase
VAAAAVATGVAAARRIYRRPVPRHDGRLGIAGLAAPLEVIRDVNGTPHIRAAGERDAFIALGLCHAQDRLFQMDLMRRLCRGTLAELAGREALDTDRYVRVLGLGRAADEEAAAAGPDAAALLDAYCTGVNAWLQAPEFRLPLEHRLLVQRRIAPWTPGDCVAAIKFFALALGQNWEGEIVRARLVERLGVERMSRLEQVYHADGYTSLPEGAAEAALQGIRARQAAGGGSGAGSNNWVLAPSRTTTGAPLLANDPHLLLGVPAIWYVADIAWPEGRVAGCTIAGFPGVVIGQSEHAAWGLTNACADTQDLFAVDLDQEPHAVRVEEIRVRGRRAPHREEVVVTRHGPVVTPLAGDATRALAIRWTALDVGRTVEAIRMTATARTGDELVQALEGFAGPVLNCVWATRGGEIGYHMIGGPVPVRGRGEGLLPQDGADAAADWQGTVPYAELPAWRDPPEGVILTANNRIVPDAYPHFISAEWLNGYRAARIAELLGARERHSVEDCLRIQTDLRSIPCLRLRDLARPARVSGDVERRALALLEAWDGEMAIDSPGAAIAATLLRLLTREVLAEAGDELERFLGSEGFSRISSGLEFFGRATPVVLDLLAAGDDDFFGDDRTWDGVFAKSLTRTCVELERRLGPDPDAWAWGDAHLLCLDHPLAALPGLQRMFRRGPVPLPGDGDTVWAGTQPSSDPESGLRTVGPGMRFVADLADPDESRIVLCGGQSGHPASPAYDDQLTDWLLGRTRRLNWSDAAIERERSATLVLEPAAG